MMMEIYDTINFVLVNSQCLTNGHLCTENKLFPTQTADISNWQQQILFLNYGFRHVCIMLLNYHNMFTN